MRTTHRQAAHLLVLACLALARLGAQVASGTKPCVVPGVQGQALCATLLVPERRDKATARRVHLHVVVLPPLGADTLADPIVVLPGGPGDATIRAAFFWARTLAPERQRRSIILVDPRGTGESDPIDCSLAGTSGKLSDYFHDFLPPDRVDACRNALAKRVDLTAYTTDAIADDLDAVRAALGYERLNLFGVSGGTREAQIYLERHAQHVRSLVLAGVLGPGFHMPLGYARDAQDAFDSLAAACRRDGACHERFPDVQDDFRRTLARLEAHPARVALPTSAPGDSATISRDMFAERIRSLLYTAENAARLPLLLNRSANGDFGPFVETIVPGGNAPRDDGVAMGHFLSITCSEDVDRIPRDEIARASANTFLGDYRVRQQRAACARWPHARLGERHFRQTRSTVPTLMITGGADPVTGPRWAAALRTVLPNSASLVFPSAGHAPMANACAIRTAAAFIDALDPRRLDVSCAAELRRPAFAQ